MCLHASMCNVFVRIFLAACLLDLRARIKRAPRARACQESSSQVDHKKVSDGVFCVAYGMPRHETKRGPYSKVALTPHQLCKVVAFL